MVFRHSLEQPWGIGFCLKAWRFRFRCHIVRFSRSGLKLGLRRRREFRRRRWRRRRRLVSGLVIFLILEACWNS
jgi:hypothetical protein